MHKTSKNKNHDIKILPHGKNDPPASTSTNWPRAAPRQDPGPLMGWRGPRLNVSRLASTGARTPKTYFPLTRGHHGGTATGQWPRRHSLNLVGGGWGQETARPYAGTGGVSAQEWRGEDSLC